MEEKAAAKQQQQQQNGDGDGVIKLPPGFRFHPTDEELVVHYLIRKALSCPLPASFIPEIDLAKFNPWDLPGCKQDKYFFALREAKYPNGKRANRATSLGYWKATGKDRAIVATRCNQVVGMKKVLVFYRGKPPNESRTTDWIMHEYRLASQRFNSAHRYWVLCHIFMKKRKMDVEEHKEERAVGFIDFMGTQRSHVSRPSSPSGSDSSCVTEGMDESSNGGDISSSSLPSSSPSPSP